MSESQNPYESPRASLLGGDEGESADSRRIRRWERTKRILVGILLPAPLGAALILLESIMSIGWRSPSQLLNVVPFVIFGYLFVGVQSVVISLLMEFVINPRVRYSLLVMAMAAFLGFISMPITVELARNGAIVGAFVGCVLRWMWLTERKPARASLRRS